MIQGQLADLEERRAIETTEDLFTYCRQVASTVGLVCIEIWGYDDPAATESRRGSWHRVPADEHSS